MIAVERKPGGRRRSRLGSRPWTSRRTAARLRIEPLEARSLLAASIGSAPVEVPHETLDQAGELGHLRPGADLQEVGSIGDGPDGAADVAWYTFTLDGPARVDFQLSRRDPASSFDGVISLFNNDPNDWGDPYNYDGYRLLEQVDAKADGGVASFDRLLGQGTYYVAVSGDGNLDFHPLLAGSGLPGITGDFALRVGAADAGLGSATGPQVLASDPAPGDVLDASPLAIRVDLSGPLDPSTILAGQTVQLLYSPDGLFSLDGTPVPLLTTNFSQVSQVPPPGPDGALHYQGLNELQIFPASPLSPGDYEVVLAGSVPDNPMVLADLSDNPLGADADHPTGQDAVIPFRVQGTDGVVGTTASDDTPAAAHQLGDVTSSGLVRIPGAIGVDPNNPFNQVDLYHFTITGAGTHSLSAEVLAGRIGSSLDPGVSLFRPDPASGQLVLVAGNNNTGDPALATDGINRPLATDSALFAGLTAGDYYLAVTYGFDTPSPFEGQVPGPGSGFYDPDQPGSAQDNFSSGGPYVLDLLVKPASAPPHVVSTSPAAGAVLAQPPTQLVVTFDQPMNVQQLAFEEFNTRWQDTVPGIDIEGADGTRYDPRFVSYDPATHRATFLMLDALPNGDYRLHLSTSAGLGDLGDGLADLGGMPLVGNDPSGDYVVPFAVDAPVRGTPGNPLAWTAQEPNDDAGHPRDLGVLFPNELVAGVTISRTPSQGDAGAPQGPADVYEFQVLQQRQYRITLSGADLPDGVALSLADASGRSLGVAGLDGGRRLEFNLDPGTYLLTVGGWDAADAARIAYQVTLRLTTQFEDATPLLSGPAQALAIQLDSIMPPSTPTPPPTVTPPTVVDQPVGDPPTTPTTGTTTAVTEPTTAAPTSTTVATMASPPTVVDPPTASGPTPAGPSPSGVGTWSVATPAAAVAAIAIPASSQGGPSAFGVTSTDTIALATGPVGGEPGPSAAPSAGVVLAQSNAAVPQSALAAGLVVMGTSLHVLDPEAGAAPAPAGPESAAARMIALRDLGGLLARVRARSMAATLEIGGRPLALVATIAETTRPIPASPGPRAPVPRGAPGPVAGPGAPRTGAEPDRPGAEAEPVASGLARRGAMFLSLAGLAVAAYARCRGLAPRAGRRRGGRTLAGPHLETRWSVLGAGIGRRPA